MELKESCLTSLAVTVDDFFVAEFVHHHLGHLVPGTAPDIHHLVVTLALGNQTVLVLSLRSL